MSASGRFCASMASGRSRGPRKSMNERAQEEAVGRLAGLPVAVKDILCERGERTTVRSRMLETFARRTMRR